MVVFSVLESSAEREAPSGGPQSLPRDPTPKSPKGDIAQRGGDFKEESGAHSAHNLCLFFFCLTCSKAHTRSILLGSRQKKICSLRQPLAQTNYVGVGRAPPTLSRCHVRLRQKRPFSSLGAEGVRFSPLRRDFLGKKYKAWGGPLWILNWPEPEAGIDRREYPFPAQTLCPQEWWSTLTQILSVGVGYEHRFPPPNPSQVL